MIDQIGRRLRRSVPRQIVGCRADHHPVRTQVLRDQIVVTDIANADRQIESFIDHIDHPVG
ncbi:hypothetical protein D3C87_1882150 [compost metagenome]